MRYQRVPWSCGPASIVNAARALGKKIAEQKVAAACGTTEADGTDDYQMLIGVRAVGLTAEQFVTEDKAAAWAFIRSNVTSGHPVVICVDSYDHWTTVVGVVGERVLIVDSANSTRNHHENGVHSLPRKDLLRRWFNRKVGEYYAIAIGRKR